MKMKTLLLILGFSACLVFGLGCDSGGTNYTAAVSDDASSSTNPATDVMPYDPPGIPQPPGGGDDPGGGSGGGSEPPGGGEQPVPEPSTLILVGSGIALITLCRKKKKKEEEI